MNSSNPDGNFREPATRCVDFSFTPAPKSTERSDVHSESHLLSSPSCSCLLFHDIPNRPLSTCSHPLKVCLTLGGRHHEDEGRESTATDGRNGQSSKDARRAGPHGPHVDMGLTTHMRVEHQKLHVLKETCEIRVNKDVHHSVDVLGLSLHPTRSFTSPLELRELACLCAFSCIRLEDVRHTVSRVTLACLCKVVERICQPLFELFSLGSPSCIWKELALPRLTCHVVSTLNLSCLKHSECLIVWTSRK